MGIEVYEYDYWFNQTELHGNVYDYGPDYVHNKIVREIIFNIDLPEGKIVMLGSHTGYGLNLLCEQYGAERVIGFDLYNPSNHPRVITGNIFDLSHNIDCALIINDIGNYKLTPKAKIYAQEWASNNTVSGGYILANTNNNNANYQIQEYMATKHFTMHRLTEYTSVTVPNWALKSYALYKRI